jgi:hypothetical protein
MMNSTAATKKNRGFDPHTFLATIGEGRVPVSGGPPAGFGMTTERSGSE